ncbi:inactive TPR repeat-containing thioredoxin TTL3 [Cucumis melo var. makuwa]|uniref:Inactive TPR repeat-containing thioredoxin TTL3 n=2 Tax=Cucumis melo TaxID=3656 RepID=A0A5A7VEQ2_CUCMM|nr:inactive TPR repeat-containing thioredoxin TTL3 [Cucumis melo var. makuwa]TYK02817.1 inactive TPR repeat-containing thioredoxin TTL3 [Cucumis melo var. makuwa]
MEKTADLSRCGFMRGIFQRRCKWLKKSSVHSLPTNTTENLNLKQPKFDNPTTQYRISEAPTTGNSAEQDQKNFKKLALLDQPRPSNSQQKVQSRRPSDAARSSTSSSNGSALSRPMHEPKPHIRISLSNGVVLGNLKQIGSGNLSANNSPRLIKEMNSSPKLGGSRSSTGSNNMGNIIRRNSCEFRQIRGRLEPDVLKSMGNEAYKKGNYEEALTFYDRAIDLDSENAVYYSNKAAALIALDRLMEAIEECKKALKFQPSYQRAHHRLATTYLRIGEPEKALDHMEQSGPYSDINDINKARTLWNCLNKCNEARKLQEWEILLKETQYAISSVSNSAYKLYAFQAEALLKLHRHQEAYCIYQKGRTLRTNSLIKSFSLSDSAILLSIEAQVYMTIGRFEEAVAAAEQSTQLDPTNKEGIRVAKWAKVVSSARLSGNLLFKESRFSEACIAYSEGLENDPYNSILLCNRAACRSKLGQYEKAVEDCTAALHAQPSYSKARLRRADCNAKMERWEASIQDYEVLIRETPGNEEVGRALFEAQIQLRKQHGEDVKDLKFGSNLVSICSYEHFRHLVTSPGMSVVLFFNKGNKKQGIEVFEQVYKRFPSVKFLKVEIEDHPYLAKLENVSSIPSFKIYRNGTIVKEIPASKPHSLESLVKLYSS